MRAVTSLNRREFNRLLLAASAALPLGAQARPPAPIRAVALDPNLVVLQGDGGNMALVLPGAAAAGLVLVDTGYLERTADLLAAIAAQTPGTVATVFNTHFHVDHVGANPALGKAGAVIMAHENVKTRLSETVTVEAMQRTFAPLPPEGRPSKTFRSGGKLATGAGEAEYTHFPTAHTDGDSYVFFRERNILHCGDLFWNDYYPLIDYSTRGWIGGMADGTARLLQLADAQTRIIPGHGALTGRTQLERSHEMLATIHQRLETMIAQGKTVDEAVAAHPSQEFDAEFGKGMNPDAFVRMAYTGIVRHRAG